MRIIGKVRLKPETALLAATAAANGGQIDVPRAVWTRAVKGTPAVGDLFWVQEPCVLYTRKNSDSQIVFGTILTARAPDGWRLDKCHKYVDDGCSLLKKQTRHTLEVKALLDDGALRCAVHAENVVPFMRRVSA